MGRTLTSAWIETFKVIPLSSKGLVALSRVRGLKLSVGARSYFKVVSHSHECVD